jgi:hypothetical protein
MRLGQVRGWWGVGLATLLAGCTLSLPVPAPTATPPFKPTVTPTAVTLPGALDFRHAHSWLSDEGVYHIMGEVVNQSENALQSIQVTGRLSDGLGQTIAEGYDLLDVMVLMPGDAAPFDVVLYGERIAASYTYQLWAAGEGVGSSRSGVTDQVEAVGLMQTGPDDALRVEGVLTNTDDRTLDRVVVLVTVFDAQGRVIGVGTATVSAPLAAGEPAAFSRTFLAGDLGGEPADYRLLAEGRLAEAAGDERSECQACDR